MYDHQAFPTLIQNQVIKGIKHTNWSTTTEIKTTKAADKNENVNEEYEKQKQQWKQRRHKNKGVMVRKEKKNTVSENGLQT